MARLLQLHIALVSCRVKEGRAASIAKKTDHAVYTQEVGRGGGRRQGGIERKKAVTGEAEPHPLTVCIHSASTNGRNPHCAVRQSS